MNVGGGVVSPAQRVRKPVKHGGCPPKYRSNACASPGRSAERENVQVRWRAAHEEPVTKSQIYKEIPQLCRHRRTFPRVIRRQAQLAQHRVQAPVLTGSIGPIGPIVLVRQVPTEPVSPTLMLPLSVVPLFSPHVCHIYQCICLQIWKTDY